MASVNVRFGTSGWRAVIAEEFTVQTLRRVAHAAAAHVKDNREFGFRGEEYLLHLKARGAAPAKSPQVIVGYDTRFLSEEYARNAAEALAADAVSAVVSDAEAPTPAVAWAVLRNNAAGGITITASHNPAHFNGLKWTPYWGGPATPEITADIEARVSSITNANAEKFVPFEQGRASGIIKTADLREDYLKQLLSLLDTKAIKAAGLKVAADAMHGAARAYLRPALERLGAKVTGLREERDVNFGGRAPDTDEPNLGPLREAVTKGRLNLGLACDGDADRFGIIDSDGSFVPPNVVLGLALEHLVTNRGMKGKVARSVMTSHFADSIAKSHGLEVRETPVGFKYIGSFLKTGQFLIGGEESGGLSIMNHVPEKDGLLACLLMAELVAYERKPLKKIVAELSRKVGTFVNSRENLRLERSSDLEGVIEKLKVRPPLNLAGSSVWRIDHTDGFKFIMKDGSWLGLRPSGTEPMVRVYAEAPTKQRMEALLDSGRKIAAGKF